MGISAHPKIPAVWSWQRLTVLVGAVLVTLGSGTNYGFSGWAPQLGARLRLSHMQLNLIALAGNLGVFSTGPLLGRITDTRGPFTLFLSAFFLLLIGYSGIRFIFDAGLPANTTTLPLSSFLVLIVCGYMTGAGGNGGATGALNSVARTFPDRMRATTAGIVFSGFGLSALFFSELAHILIGVKPSLYLNMLAWGTAILMLVGLMVVRPIHLPLTETYQPVQDRGRDEEDGRGSPAPVLDTTETTHLLKSQKKPEKASSDVFGKALLANLDFGVLFIILSIFSGIGLMYINNVGSIVQVLVTNSDGSYDRAVSARWQAAQVSVISVMNFVGRIFFGCLSDLAKKNKLPRSLCLPLISLTLLVSLITVAHVDHIEYLWKASTFLGLGYGGTYVVLASLLMEYFGLEHFSENWGYLCLSPLFGGNVFSLAFGQNLDAHEMRNSVESSLSFKGCTSGRYCYVDAIYLVIVGCIIGVGLSIWMCWRDWRRQRQLNKLVDCE